MSTLRNQLEHVKDYLEAIDANGEDPAEIQTNIDNALYHLEALDKLIDEAEGNNNLSIEAVEKLEGSEYMEDIVEEIKEPLENNHKLLY